MTSNESPDVLRIKALVERRAALDAAARAGAMSDRAAREIAAIDAALASERAQNPKAFATATATAPPARASQPPTARDFEELPADWDLYEPKDLLGEGGMGRVYRVHHRGWGVDLAVKVPRKSVLDERARRSVLREAESWSALGLHPFVTTCYYTRVRDGVPWLFAEFVEGGSLHQAIRSGSLYQCADPLARILAIAVQSARGLHHAHERALVHQDVKPANILLAPGFIAKVTDFGLARAARVPAERDPRPTREGTMVVRFGGMTPAYASPEQLAASQGTSVAITRRTDVFSWAATVLEMFAGGLTWMAGPAAIDALAMLVGDGPPAPAIPAIPRELASLLERCFATRQSARPSTLEIVADEVAAIYAARCGAGLADTSRIRRSPADAIYNRGASKLDLDEPELALALFDEALRADPSHPQATFARSLLRWRRAACTDDEAVRALSEAASMREPSWQHALLEASLHAERGDLAQARAALARLAERGRRSPEALAAVARISPALRDSMALVTRAPIDRAPSLVALSRDGAVIAVACTAPAEQAPSLTEVSSVTARGPAHRWTVEGAPRALWARRDSTALVVTDRALFRLTEHGAVLARTGPWDTAAFSTTGELVASRFDDACSQIIIIDPRTGYQRTFTSPGRASIVALSPGGAQVAIADAQSVTVWDVARGAALFTKRFLRDPECLAFAEHGEALLVGGWDDSGARGLIAAFRVSDGARVAALHDPSPPRAIALSSDGEQLLSLSTDGTTRLWLVREARCLRTVRAKQAHERVFAIASSAEGARFALGRAQHVDVVACDSKPVRAAVPVVQPPTSEQTLERERALGAALERSERAAREGRWAAAVAALEQARSMTESARAPAVRRAWARLTRVCERGALSGAWTGACFEAVAGAAHTVELSPDGETLYVTTGDSRVLCIASRSGRTLHELRFDEAVRTFQVAPCSGVIAACRGSVLEWRAPSTGALIATAPTRVLCRRMATDWTARRVALVGAEQLELFALDGPPRLVATPGITRAAFVGDSDTVLVASTSGAVKIVAHSGNTLGELPSSDGAIDVVCTSDGAFAAAGLRDGHARVYDLRSRSLLATLSHGAVVTGVALSQDARVLVAVDASGQVRVWDVARGEGFALGGHETFVHDVALTPSARVAATGGRDGRARVLWIDWALEPPPDGFRWSEVAERATQALIDTRLHRRHDALRVALLALDAARAGPVAPADVQQRLLSARASVAETKAVMSIG